MTRLLGKIAMKFGMLVIMVAMMGAVLRFARPYLMKAAGVPEGMPGMSGVESVHFSSEESDLMTTVFKSALRLFSGTAKRDELASELSDKLYAGRDPAAMKELGIELVKPGGSPSAPETTGDAAKPKPGASVANSKPGAKQPAKPETGDGPAAETPSEAATNKVREALLTQFWAKTVANPELSLVPIVLLGMVVVHRIRGRRRSPGDAFMLPDMALNTPAESEPYDMSHAVHSLNSEDFELLVALIYQRQGYRITMSAALSGGRGGDFMLLRKSERLLVQCKRLSPDHKVDVERVRELHDAVAAAGATRGIYVAPCSFSWDARNFAKAKGVTVINARTLDALLTAARKKPDEDLLAVSEWAPKFMGRVQLTSPRCPACEAETAQLSVSNGSVWVCSQRPDCRGRRIARKYQKPDPAAACNANNPAADEVNGAPQTPPVAQAAATPASPPGDQSSEFIKMAAAVAARKIAESKLTPQTAASSRKPAATPTPRHATPPRNTVASPQPAAAPSQRTAAAPRRTSAPPQRASAPTQRATAPPQNVTAPPPQRTAVPPQSQRADAPSRHSASPR